MFRPSRSIRLLVPLIAVGTIAAGCGSDDAGPVDDPTSGDTSPPTAPPDDGDPGAGPVVLPDDPDTIVLELMTSVNQPDPIPIATAVPTFRLYADGRVIAHEPFIDTTPIPPLAEAALSVERVEELVAEALRRGEVDPTDTDFDPALADADSTSLTVTTAGGTRTFRLGSPDPDATDDDHLLEAMAATLENWPETLHDDLTSPMRQFVGEQLLVLVHTDRVSLADVGLPVDLTVGAQEVDTRVVPISCTAIDPDTELLDAIVDSGRQGGVGFRPVLPGEPGCAVVAEL